MARSEVAICNRALVELGIGTIMDLTEDNEVARACLEHYEASRDSVLVEGNWNFAMKRASLQQLVEAPEWEYDNAFQLPPNCLRVVKMKDQATFAWKVEGRTLVTNNNEAKIVYVEQVTDTTQFSTMFENALVARIAAELSEPLKAIRTKNQDFWNIYRLKLQNGRTTDGFEGTPEEDDANPLADVRSGRDRWPTWWG